MATYEVTAYVTVEVKMFVEADSADEAKALIDNHLAMTATLVDVPAETFTVIDDEIDQIEGLSAEPADPESLIE